MAAQLEIVPEGPFSLRLAAGFGFGPYGARAAEGADVLRLAFLVDGEADHAGVALTQPETDGSVVAAIQSDADPQAVRAQVARVLSLDHDGTPFVAAGERDPVLGALQQRHHGLRPVLFHSPYEAAAWAIISHRRPGAQAARTRDAVAERLGASFDVGGERLHAFPTPRRLLELEPGAGLPSVKVERLHALAHATLDGRLRPDRLQALEAERALAHLQELPGIGPFSAALILLRGTGVADVVTAAEPRLLRAAAHFYDLDAPPDLDGLTRLAEPWRPRRTWACVLLRYAAEREGALG